MPRFASSFRSVIGQKLSLDQALRLFGQILDGVEAAHLQNVTRRDLKPENILVNAEKSLVVIADFGIARFVAELLHTAVETAPTTRLANFQYAAPEQRIRDIAVTSAADI